MKIIYFATYYERYLENFQRKNDLSRLTYNEIYNLLLYDNFGVFGQYTQKACLLGHNAILVVANCRILQKKWAEENSIDFNLETWKFTVAIEQVKKFKPEIFFSGSMFEYFGDFLKEIKPFCGSLMAWTSCPIPSNISFKNFSLVLSSVPNFVKRFREIEGVKSELLLPSFDRKIYDSLSERLKKDIEFSFIGGLSSNHINRVQLLTELATKTNIHIYGYNYTNVSFIKRFFKSFPLLKAYKGECWGLDMYETLGRSLITFNSHGEIAENYAGNMRMFEATGMGSLLLTDHKDNIHEIFRLDEEIVTYKSVEEAISKVNYLLSNRSELEKIAKAGQGRTFSCYSFEIATGKMIEYFLEYMKK
jgi:spore maturation protein CgeB